MELKRIDVLSAVKVTFILYAALGFLFGALISTAAALGSGFEGSDGSVPGGGVLLGLGAVIIIPPLYGAMGAFFAAIGALLYNLTARLVGGIRVELS